MALKATGQTSNGGKSVIDARWLNLPRKSLTRTSNKAIWAISIPYRFGSLGLTSRPYF